MPRSNRTNLSEVQTFPDFPDFSRKEKKHLIFPDFSGYYPTCIEFYIQISLIDYFWLQNSIVKSKTKMNV